MHVMVGLRRRFATFCDFALVSNAISPSRKPYHIATMWMVPSALSDANDIVCFPCEELVDLLVGHLDLGRAA